MEHLRCRSSRPRLRPAPRHCVDTCAMLAKPSVHRFILPGVVSVHGRPHADMDFGARRQSQVLERRVRRGVESQRGLVLDGKSHRTNMIFCPIIACSSLFWAIRTVEKPWQARSAHFPSMHGAAVAR